MDWIQTCVILFGNMAWMIPLFLWNRSEANADRRDIVNLMFSMKEEASRFRAEMAQEMKDFHGRLCAIEESKKNNMKS